MSAAATLTPSARDSELAELRDSARQVLSELGLAADDHQAWPHMVELGWLLVAVPESLGGLGQGIAGACAFHAEFGRRLAPASYSAALLAIDAVCQSAVADPAPWVERLSGGDYATAPLAESTVQFSRAADGRLCLNGLATAVPSADRASHVLVCSAEADRVALVPLAQAGIERIARPTWDLTRRLYDLRFSEAGLDGALMLAEGEAAQTLQRRLATLRDFTLAADAVGGAEALLAMTVDYLQTRRQFGRPLALFQALKHRCADLQMQVSGAQALLLDSLRRLDERAADPSAEILGIKAKHQACTVYARVAEEALQLHGGIGMTSEHPCHLFLKRALLNEHLGRRNGRYPLAIADDFLNRSA